MNTNIISLKRAMAITMIAVFVLMIASTMVFAAEHPHYMPPQISSYPSVSNPPSGQETGVEDGCEDNKHEDKSIAAWGYFDAI